MFKILPLLCALTTLTQASTDDSPLFEPITRLKEEKIHVVERCVRSKETRIETGFVSHFMYKPDDPTEARHGGTNWDTNSKPINTFSWGEGIFSKYDCHDFSDHHLYNTFPVTGWLWKTDKEMERTKIFYVDLEISDYTFWTWTGFYKDHSVRAAYGAIPLAHNLLLKEVVGIIPSESFKRRRKILPHKSYLYPS